MLKMHHFRRQPGERPTFSSGIRVEDRVPTQDIAGERLIMAAGALPCPCKVRHLYVIIFKLFIFHLSSFYLVQMHYRCTVHVPRPHFDGSLFMQNPKTIKISYTKLLN
jgi:hypothetical protein